MGGQECPADQLEEGGQSWRGSGSEKDSHKPTTGTEKKKEGSLTECSLCLPWGPDLIPTTSYKKTL